MVRWQLPGTGRRRHLWWMDGFSKGQETLIDRVPCRAAQVLDNSRQVAFAQAHENRNPAEAGMQLSGVPRNNAPRRHVK